MVKLLIIVDHVVSLRRKQLVKLFVLEDLIKHPDLVNSWFRTLVSDSGSCHRGKEKEMDLPEKSLVEHHKGKCCVGCKGSSPSVI